MTGHPYVDVWQGVRPRTLGIAAWPQVPRGQPWKEGVCAALGYAQESGIPFQFGLVRNHYVGRTFIMPGHEQRSKSVRSKLNAIDLEFRNKNVLLVDDSIVRGSTTRKLVQMLRDAGANEVHLRVSSPPYRWPCYYGMDTSDPSTLIAASLDVEEIRDHVGADSLGYLSLRGLLDATGVADAGFCTACLSGEYPTDVPE